MIRTGIFFFLILLSSVMSLADVKAPAGVKPKTDVMTPPAKAEVDIEKHKLSNNEKKQVEADAVEVKLRWSKRIPRSMSLATSKRQLRAHKYLASKNYPKAVDVLNKILERSSTEKYERAKTLVLLAQAYLSMEKTTEAEVAIADALALESLSYNESCDALLFLAQTQLLSRNYKESKINVIKYISVAPTKVPAAYIMLATIEYELQENADAQKSIETALSLSKEPQETWLFFASAVYSRNKNFLKAEEILRQLLDKRQNNKNYWMGIIGVLYEQEKYAEALKHYELADKLGYVKSSSEVNSKVALYGAGEIPYKAAKLIEHAISNGTLEKNRRNYENLASNWFTAKEYDKAIAAYQEASRLSDTGEVDLMLGQVFLEQEDWAAAEKAFRTALQKGKLKQREGFAFIGLGMTSYFKEDKESALKYFNRAVDYKAQKEAASKWLSYLK